jgi:AcrR family transcriptional regulator
MSRAVLAFLVIALVLGHHGPMPPATARARARAEITEEILAAARAQLAEVGADGLSLRAVAREVGMVSSAVYRYFPSKEQLLTSLIVEAYDSLGACVEEAEAGIERTELRLRWFTVGRAVREWAIGRPHEYALIYGSPVPGYRAPVTTVAPATRVALVLLRLVLDAQAHDRLADRPLVGTIPESLDPDLERLRTAFGDASDAVIVRALTAWTALYGLVSFELFGQFHNVIAANAAFFDLSLGELADFLGIDPGNGP